MHYLIIKTFSLGGYMRINQFIGASFLALSLALTPVSADQLETEAREAAAAPAAMLVKVNPVTRTVEVFRANVLDRKILNQTASSADTAAAVNAIENPANKIAEYRVPTNELDKETSTEAYYYRGYGYGYRWYGWGGYRPYYYNYYNPYYYGAGYFNYYNTNYYYNYAYTYRNCYYGWYY